MSGPCYRLSLWGEAGIAERDGQRMKENKRGKPQAERIKWRCFLVGMHCVYTEE